MIKNIIKENKVKFCVKCGHITYFAQNHCSECGQTSERTTDQLKEKLIYFLNPVD